jgi:hypothetical protein
MTGGSGQLPIPHLDDETIEQLRRLLFGGKGRTMERKTTRHVAPEGPAPECECGCGERVKSAANGVWSRWRVGHHHNRGSGEPHPVRKGRRAS